MSSESKAYSKPSAWHFSVQMHEQRGQGLQTHQSYENVVPHTELTTIREEWDTILRLKSQDHTAADSGSMCTRHRLYWANSVDLSEMPELICSDTGV